MKRLLTAAIMMIALLPVGVFAQESATPPSTTDSFYQQLYIKQSGSKDSCTIPPVTDRFIQDMTNYEGNIRKILRESSDPSLQACAVRTKYTLFGIDFPYDPKILTEKPKEGEDPGAFIRQLSLYSNSIASSVDLFARRIFLAMNDRLGLYEFLLMVKPFDTTYVYERDLKDAREALDKLRELHFDMVLCKAAGAAMPSFEEIQSVEDGRGGVQTSKQQVPLDVSVEARYYAYTDMYRLLQLSLSHIVQPDEVGSWVTPSDTAVRVLKQQLMPNLYARYQEEAKRHPKEYDAFTISITAQPKLNEEISYNPFHSKKYGNEAYHDCYNPDYNIPVVIRSWNNLVTSLRGFNDAVLEFQTIGNDILAIGESAQNLGATVAKLTSDVQEAVTGVPIAEVVNDPRVQALQRVQFVLRVNGQVFNRPLAQPGLFELKPLLVEQENLANQQGNSSAATSLRSQSSDQAVGTSFSQQQAQFWSQEQKAKAEQELNLEVFKNQVLNNTGLSAAAYQMKLELELATEELKKMRDATFDARKYYQQSCQKHLPSNTKNECAEVKRKNSTGK